MSRHSHGATRHPHHHGSGLWFRLLLAGLALPGMVALALFFWVAPGGQFVLGGLLAVSAMLAIGCGSWLAGRSAAGLYNFLRLWAGRSGLEKLMRPNQTSPHPRTVPPRPAA